MVQFFPSGLIGFEVKKFDLVEREELPSEAFGFSAGGLSNFSQKRWALTFLVSRSEFGTSFFSSRKKRTKGNE